MYFHQALPADETLAASTTDTLLVVDKIFFDRHLSLLFTWLDDEIPETIGMKCLLVQKSKKKKKR